MWHTRPRVCSSLCRRHPEFAPILRELRIYAFLFRAAATEHTNPAFPNWHKITWGWSALRGQRYRFATAKTVMKRTESCEGNRRRCDSGGISMRTIRQLSWCHSERSDPGASRSGAEGERSRGTPRSPVLAIRPKGISTALAAVFIFPSSICFTRVIPSGVTRALRAAERKGNEVEGPRVRRYSRYGRKAFQPRSPLVVILEFSIHLVSSGRRTCFSWRPATGDWRLGYCSACPFTTRAIGTLFPACVGMAPTNTWYPSGL